MPKIYNLFNLIFDFIVLLKSFFVIMFYCSQYLLLFWHLKKKNWKSLSSLSLIVPDAFCFSLGKLWRLGSNAKISSSKLSKLHLLEFQVLYYYRWGIDDSRWNNVQCSDGLSWMEIHQYPNNWTGRHALVSKWYSEGIGRYLSLDCWNEKGNKFNRL